MIDNGWLKQNPLAPPSSRVIHCPSPNFNARPSNTGIDLIVVHNISLPPSEFGGGFIEQFFQNELDHSVHSYFQTIEGLHVSSHCLIARDGCMSQFVSFQDRAWHAGVSQYGKREQCNDFSVGIELEGADDIAYEPIQYTRLVDLIRSLIKTYPTLSVDKIVGHSDIAPGRKTDPGPAFDWPYLRRLLKKRE